MTAGKPPEVVQALQLLTDGAFEIRVLEAELVKGEKRRPCTAFARFDDPWKAYHALLEIGAVAHPHPEDASPPPAGAHVRAENAKGVYVTLNRLAPTVELVEQFRAAKKGELVSDDVIDHRRWLVVDIDPNRTPADSSSTREELQYANVIAQRVKGWLAEHGWPDPIQCLSGNGIHLLYRVDLPHDSRRVASLLKHLSFKFSDAKVKIDTTLSDAARIVRLYGTYARKGEDTEERPHRKARILHVPEKILSVPRACLDNKNLFPIQEVQFEVSEEQKEAKFAALDAWLDAFPLAFDGPIVWEKGRKYILPVCPWDPEHDDRAAYIIQFKNGGISAGCMHETCRAHGWADLTEKYGALTTRSNVPDAQEVVTRFSLEAQNTGQTYLACTDIGNAQRFVAMFGDRVRFVSEKREWLIWNGRRWEVDLKNQVLEMAKTAISMIEHEANAIDDAKKAQAMRIWHVKSQMAPRVRAVLDLVQVDPRIVTSSAQWDKDPWLLTVENGTIDLRTGRLHGFDRNNCITKQAPVRFDPDADCPTWRNFVDVIMCGDQDRILYVQRALGYALTGIIKEQCMFLLTGGGSNGKTTLLTAVQEILGEFATTAAPDLLTVSRAGESKHSAGEADLQGARFVVVSEADRGAFLSEALVKRLTGEETQKARFMHKNWFTFKTTFKLFMMCNHKPRIRGADNGIWRRMHVIPFDRKFEEHEKDTDMPEKLRAEYSGILNWLLEGLAFWQKHTIAPPSAVRDATMRYRADMDQLAGFISEWCDLTNKDSFILSRELYAAYCAYCRQEGLRAVEHETFKLMLEERGYQSVRRAAGTGRRGLALRVDRVLVIPDAIALEG